METPDQDKLLQAILWGYESEVKCALDRMKGPAFIGYIASWYKTYVKNYENNYKRALLAPITGASVEKSVDLLDKIDNFYRNKAKHPELYRVDPGHKILRSAFSLLGDLTEAHVQLQWRGDIEGYINVELANWNSMTEGVLPLDYDVEIERELIAGNFIENTRSLTADPTGNEFIRHRLESIEVPYGDSIEPFEYARYGYQLAALTYRSYYSEFEQAERAMSPARQT